MNSDRLPLANKDPANAYRRNQAKSISFLVILAILLVIAAMLSLRAGSYNTPISELIKGIFGKAADKKINIVVRNNQIGRAHV